MREKQQGGITIKPIIVTAPAVRPVHSSDDRVGKYNGAKGLAVMKIV